MSGPSPEVPDPQPTGDRDRWWMAVPALAPLVVFAEVVAGRRLAAPGDGHTYYLALRAVVGRSWRAGALPAWDPWAFGGSPLLALHQPGVFYPLTLVGLLLPAVAAQHLLIIGSFVLAGTGAYLLGRRLGSDPVGAAVTGLAFGLSGFLFGHVVHVAIVATVAWLPWLLWGFERVRERLTPGRLAVGSGSLALAILAGHGQMAVFAIAVLGLYAAVVAGFEGRAGWRSVGLASLVTAVGLGLAAVQLMPVVALLGETSRAGLTYREATAWSFSPSSTVLLVFPYAFGNQGASGPFTAPYQGEWSLTELSGYAGAAALVLAAAGLGAGALRRDRRLVGLLVVAALSLLVALGDSTPAGRLVHALPLLGRFRSWGRYAVGFDLVVAALAGLGVTRLRSAAPAERRAAARRAAIGAGGVAALAALTLAWPAVADQRVSGAPLAWSLGAPLVAAAAGAGLAVAAGRDRRWTVVLVPLVALDLVAFGAFFRWRDHSPTVEQASALISGAAPPPWGAVPDAAGGIDRMLYAGSDALTLVPWYQRVPDAQRVRSANGFDPLAPRRYTEAVGDMNELGSLSRPERVWSPESHVLDLLRVSLVLTDQDTAAAPPPAALGAGRPVPGRPLVAHPRQPRLPDAFLVGKVLMVDRDTALAGLWGEVPLDPAATALVDGDCPQCPSRDRPGGAGPVGRHRWGLNSAHFEVVADRPALLVVSQAWSPGWSASVNRRSAPVVRVDGLVQGVPVPAGPSTVTLRYRPPGLVLGTVISGLTVAGLAGWGIREGGARSRIIARLRSRSAGPARSGSPPRRRRRGRRR